MSRYAGGKNGAGVYQTIINAIPWHWRYVEAFAGSAAIYRHKAPAAGGSVLIERDPAQWNRLHLELESPGTVVLEGDALQLLPTLGLGPHDFVYLDPPYHPSARRDLDLYTFELTADDHAQLLHSLLPAITAARTSWALSGYRCAAYDDACRRHGWHRTDYTAQTRRGPVTESLWTNFDPARVDRLHDYRYLGTDFRERERIARKIRRWSTKLQALDRRERQALVAAMANIDRAGDAGLEPGAIARTGERIPPSPHAGAGDRVPAGAR